MSSVSALDNSFETDAAFKAFTLSPLPSPLTGANAVLLTSTPNREATPQDPVAGEGEEMSPESHHENF